MMSVKPLTYYGLLILAVLGNVIAAILLGLGAWQDYECRSSFTSWWFWVAVGFAVIHAALAVAAIGLVFLSRN